MLAGYWLFKSSIYRDHSIQVVIRTAFQLVEFLHAHFVEEVEEAKAWDEVQHIHCNEADILRHPVHRGKGLHLVIDHHKEGIVDLQDRLHQLQHSQSVDQDKDAILIRGEYYFFGDLYLLEIVNCPNEGQDRNEHDDNEEWVKCESDLWLDPLILIYVERLLSHHHKHSWKILAFGKWLKECQGV